MKILKNQSGIAPLAIVLLTGITGIIGFTGYRVYEMNKEKPQESYQTPQKADKKEEPKKPEIPEGYVEYKNEELGLRFAYPEEWGSVEKMKGYDEAVFRMGFSTGRTPVPDAPGDFTYQIELYANAGGELGGRREAAVWDHAGFKKSGEKYLARQVWALRGQIRESYFEIEDPTAVKAKNTEVVLHEYEYYGAPLTEILFNLEGEYYGGTLIVDTTNKTHVNQLKEVAKTFEIL